MSNNLPKTDINGLLLTLVRDCKESLLDELEGEEELWVREAQGLTLNWNRVFQSDAHFDTIQDTIIINFKELPLTSPAAHLRIAEQMTLVPAAGTYSTWQSCLASQVDATIVQYVSQKILNEWIENND